jgi:hypothetical protein
MSKAKRKPSEASNQNPRTVRPLFVALIILGLIVSAIAFVLVPTSVKGMCVATAAALVWMWLHASGRL